MIVLFVLALLGLLIGPGCSAPAPAPVPGVAPAPARPAVADEVRRRQTIAVYPFDNNAVTSRERLDFLREWLPDVVGGTLRDAGELRLVERRELLRILQEQKLGSSELASKEGRLRLARMAGAQTLVFGGFTAIGDTLRIDSRIVDAESGVVVRTASVHGAPAEARSLGERLAREIADGLGLDVTRRTTAAGVTDDRALRGAEFFYEGLALEKEGKKEQAVEAYREAIRINREDEEARRRLKGLLAAP